MDAAPPPPPAPPSTILSVEEACRRLRQNDEALTNLKVLFSSSGNDDNLPPPPPHHNPFGAAAIRRNSVTRNRRNEEAIQLASALENNSVLQSLDLQDAGLQDDDVSVIGRALEVHPSLEQWGLCNNAIGVDGSSAIADFLVRNETLTSLALQQNDLGPDGAAELGDALTTNRTLRRLQLQSNRIRSDGTSRLAQALGVNRALASLDLSSNEVGDEGLGFLMQVVLGRSTGGALEELILMNNGITDEGAQDLADALLMADLPETSSLVRFDLSSNPITTAGATAIRKAMLQSKSSNLPVIKLDEDPVMEEEEEPRQTEDSVVAAATPTMNDPAAPESEQAQVQDGINNEDDDDEANQMVLAEKEDEAEKLAEEVEKPAPDEGVVSGDSPAVTPPASQSRLESSAFSFEDESEHQTITSDIEKPISLLSLDRDVKEKTANGHAAHDEEGHAIVVPTDDEEVHKYETVTTNHDSVDATPADDDKEPNITSITTVKRRSTKEKSVEQHERPRNEEEGRTPNGIQDEGQQTMLDPTLTPSEPPESLKVSVRFDGAKELEVVRVPSVKGEVGDEDGGETQRKTNEDNCSMQVEEVCTNGTDHGISQQEPAHPACDSTDSTPVTVTLAKQKHEEDDTAFPPVSQRHCSMTTAMGMSSSLLVELDTAEEVDRPLHAAIKHSHVVTLVEELRQRNVNEADSRGRTPADYAAICGEVQMLSLLENRGGEFRIGSKAKMRSLAEHRALEKAASQPSLRSSISLGDVGGSLTSAAFSTPEAQVLLMAASVGFDASLREDEEGEFPLHAAIRYEDLELLQEEVEDSEDKTALFRRVDALGRSAADFCAIRGEVEMLKWLESMGGGVFFVGSRARMRRVCRDVAMARRRQQGHTPPEEVGGSNLSLASNPP